jgi:pSer/pThr/pTyr-binding forkhead associated (FHA) protein
MGDAWAPPDWAIAPQSAARLVPAAGAAAAEIDLGARPFYLIGREAPADVVIDHPGVSRRAAALVHHPKGLYVIDLASREGVFIDGARLPPVRVVWALGGV